jgi:hypothetical protein
MAFLVAQTGDFVLRLILHDLKRTVSGVKMNRRNAAATSHFGQMIMGLTQQGDV